LSPTVEVAVDRAAALGEGPFWDDARGELLSVDIDAGLIHFDRLDGQTTTVSAPRWVSAIVPCTSGGYVLAANRGISTLDEQRSIVTEIVVLEADARTRMNDAKCDPAGRLWAGSMDLGESAPLGSLHRVSPGSPPTRALSELTISNGIGWSPDCSTMYFIDTGTGRIDTFRYDLAEGSISSRRHFVSVERGYPDGLAVDAEGGVWVALWGGAAVRRYAPNGALDREIELPVSQVTSCCFGGPSLETLFVTTASVGLDAPESHAGAVFAFDPGIDGLPVARYAG
jgi:sugar lactone lactonase YvrE